MKPLAALLLAILLAGCVGRYTGAEYYYTDGGVNYSCREPEPYRGGNCKVENEWPDGGVDAYHRQ